MEQPKTLLEQLPEEVRQTYSADNQGNLISKNRAYRRRKPPTDNIYTKNTHKFKMIWDARRKKASAAKRKQKREEAKHN